MKRLTLHRHAKSSWSDPDCADHDRPLNERGLRVAPEMARRYAEDILGTPDRILTSSAARAHATAEILAQALDEHGRTTPLETRAELYLAPPDRYFEAVWSLDDRLSHVVLVGHNPGLLEFAQELEPAPGIDRLPTAALVVFQFDVDLWRSVQPRMGERLVYWVPKDIDVA